MGLEVGGWGFMDSNWVSMEKLQASLLMGGPRSSPCWQSSSPHLHGAFGVEPGSHVPLWLSPEHLPLTAISTLLMEHLAKVMSSHVPRFWVQSPAPNGPK